MDIDFVPEEEQKPEGNNRFFKTLGESPHTHEEIAVIKSRLKVWFITAFTCVLFALAVVAGIVLIIVAFPGAGR